MTTPSSTADARPTILAAPLGMYQTNCYAVIPPAGVGEAGACWLVDCGQDPGDLLDAVEERGLRPTVIVLTHAHHDHIEGLTEARRRFPRVPIWIHRAEKDWLTDPMLNLSAVAGAAPASAPEADRLLDGGEELDLCGQVWRVLHTPGHSPGGITLSPAPSRTAFVGDALFAGSIGRTDLPGGDHPLLERSIREKLYTLPDETVCLPGHGPATTVGREKASNPFVRP